MRNAECGMRNAECGMRNAECGMRNENSGNADFIDIAAVCYSNVCKIICFSISQLAYQELFALTASESSLKLV